MANITGQGRPTRTLKANKGDIYTDANTGIKYECLGPDGFIDVEGVDEPEYYDWKEIKTSGGGTGGVSSWNDLTDKPFGTYVSNLPLFEKYTVDIVQTQNDSGTYYAGQIEGFGKYDTLDDLRSDLFVTWLTDGVIKFDNDEYKTNIINQSPIKIGPPQLLPGSNSMSDSTLPWFIHSTDTGFEIVTTEEYSGTHEVAIYVTKTEVELLEEKYIPASIQRVDERAFPLIKAELNGQEYKIPAGETTATLTPSISWNTAELQDTEGILCFAVGDYITSHTGEGTLDEQIEVTSIPLECRLEKSFSPHGMYPGKYSGSARAYVTISEAIEYDINVTLYSNKQFTSYHPM